MTLTMYEMTIPTMLRGFGALSGYLERAEEFVRVSGLEASDLIQARLAPDMLTFAGQIQRASDKAKGGVANLAGIESPSFSSGDCRVMLSVLRVTSEHHRACQEGRQ